MYDEFERYAKLIAVLSSIALVEGILFNLFYFLALGVVPLSVLSIGDYLSTAAGHVPFVAAALGLAIYFTRGKPKFRARGRLAFLRTWLGKAIIGLVASIFVLAIWFDDKLVAGLSGFFLLGAWIVNVTASLALNEHRTAIRLETLRIMTVASIILIASSFLGYMTGAVAYELERPHVRVQTDGDKIVDGHLIGIFDRATFILEKPSNHLVVLGQRSRVHIQTLDRVDSFEGSSKLVYGRIVKWRDAIKWMLQKAHLE